MVFYSDLVKKVNEGKVKELKNEYTFRLNLKKTVFTLAVGIPTLLAGLLEIMVIVQQGFRGSSILYFFFSAVGAFFLSTIFTYKVIIKDGSLFLNKKEIKFDEMVKCSLENLMLPRGKTVEPSLRILTDKNEEFIFHLHMAHRLQYLLVMKELLGEKFEIIEEN